MLRSEVCVSDAMLRRLSGSGKDEIPVIDEEAIVPESPPAVTCVWVTTRSNERDEAITPGEIIGAVEELVVIDGPTASFTIS